MYQEISAMTEFFARGVQKSAIELDWTNASVKPSNLISFMDITAARLAAIGRRRGPWGDGSIAVGVEFVRGRTMFNF